MRNPLNIDDFESYLEEEVNQHRMYPSDYVWRNIQQDLHGYKKWPALTVITLFVISALVAGTLLIKPSRQVVASSPAVTAKVVAETIYKVEDTNENLQQHLSPEHITQQTISAVTADLDIEGSIQNAFAAYHVFPEMPSDANITENAATITAAQGAGAVTNAVATNIAGTLSANTINKSSLAVLAPQAHDDGKAAPKKNIPSWEKNLLGFNWMKAEPLDDQNPDRFYLTKGVWKAVYGKIFYLTAERLPVSHSAEFNTFYSNIERNATKQLTSNNYKSQSRTGRFQVQVYVTPSVSYRILAHAGSKSNTYLSAPSSSGAGYLVDVNSLARKKPAAGYEVGASIGYKLNSDFTLRAGLQFNVRQYDIQGATVNPAPAIANNNTNVNNNGVASGLDLSLQTAQSIQSTKENPNVVLTNMYYQIALPVGIDWKAWSHRKFSWNVAGSVQPTYILNKDPFIVASADKSYAEGSALLRKWNLNTSVETYVSYTTGKFKWQIGPQVRYQVLSTLKSSYPVSEHLLEYGIKVGFVRSLP